MSGETDWAANPLIITVAPTGAEVTREQNPAVPYTPSEIAEETVAAHGAGASIVHLHVREPDGTPSADPALFKETIGQIRDRCDVITMVTTGGAVGMSTAERAAGLDGDPEMAGIEVGSINYGDDVFITSASETRELSAAIRERGVTPEVEAFEVSHVESAFRFQAEGILEDPIRINAVLGVPGGLGATIRNLSSMAAAIPPGTRWSVTAIGRAQRRILAAAILFGASGVRVGLEDNVYLEKGRLAVSNAELVAQIRELAEGLGRTVATPTEARRLLQLSPAVDR